MRTKELKIFYDICCLYDQVRDLTNEDQELINSVIKLGDRQEWKAIDVLYNEDDFCEDAEELSIEYFCKSIYDMNQLADKFGFQRIGPKQQIISFSGDDIMYQMEES